jgi:hypothetical protein
VYVKQQSNLQHMDYQIIQIDALQTDHSGESSVPNADTERRFGTLLATTTKKSLQYELLLIVKFRRRVCANICMYADSYPRIELNIWLSKLLQNIKLIRIYTVLVFVISCTTDRLRLFLCYLAYAHIQSEMPVGLVLFLTRKKYIYNAAGRWIIRDNDNKW